MFVARAAHRDPFASLFICQRFTLQYLMIFNLILHSNFCQQNTKRRIRVGNLQRDCHLAWKLGKLKLFMNLNWVPLIVLGFFNFHFPIDFIGGQ